MEGLFVAGAVIAVVEFWRLRDRRLVPLALMLAFLAGVQGREPWDAWRRGFQVAAVASGLALLALFSIDRRAAARRARDGAWPPT